VKMYEEYFLVGILCFFAALFIKRYSLNRQKYLIQSGRPLILNIFSTEFENVKYLTFDHLKSQTIRINQYDQKSLLPVTNKVLYIDNHLYDEMNGNKFPIKVIINRDLFEGHLHQLIN